MAYGLTKSAHLVRASDQYFTAADSASLSPTGNQTWEGWVKWNVLPSSGSQAQILNKTKTGASADSFSFIWWMVNTSGTYTMEILTSSNGSSFSGDIVFSMTAPSTGVWYHYRVTYTTTGPAINVYVDGVSLGAGVGPVATSIFDGVALLWMGTYGADPTNSLDANLSLFRIWSEVHTTNDRCVVYGSAQSNLAAEWSLDNVLTDSSGNSNTLTNINTATFQSDVPSICTTVATTLPYRAMLGVGI